MSVATTTTSKDNKKHEKTVETSFFHIDMIPDAMEKMGWVMAPQLMRHWFSISPAFAFTEKSKKETLDTDATKLNSSLVNSDIVKMSWAMNYKQVHSGVENLKKKWKSIRGIERLRKILKNKGNYEQISVAIGYTNDVKELDATAQVNTMSIGSKLDTIDDWYGAMGNSNLKICVRGKTEIRGNNIFFLVEKIGFYLKDTYDFVDADKISEPLGVWSNDRILNKTETGLYMSSYLSGLFGTLVRSFSGFVPVFNSDFRNWQKKHKSGGDFIVFSDVLWVTPDNNDKEILLNEK